MGSLFQQPEVLVAAVSAIVACIVWFVRLEGRVNYEAKISGIELAALKSSVELSHKRIDETKAKSEVAEERILSEMSAMKVQLAEFSGYLRKDKEKG